MPRSQQIINGFLAGEISPKVWGRTESDEYPYSCEAVRECFVSGRGGVFRRPGMHYVRPTKFPGKKVRMIPFVFSRTQSYVLEFGDLYVRFYRDSGYVENVEGVRSFIGDGTSDKYLYPFPSVAIGDVKVLVNGEEKVVNTDYTIAPADLVNSQIEDFTNVPAWDTNYTDAENPAALSPWVLAGNTAATPDNSEPILRQSGINIARGSVVDFSVDIDSLTRIQDNWTNTLASDVVLGNDFVVVASQTMTGREEWGHLKISGTVNFAAAAPNKADVVTAQIEYGTAAGGWTKIDEIAFSVDDAGEDWVFDELVEGPFPEDTIVRLLAKQSNNEIVEINATTGSTFNLDGLVDYYADLYAWTVGPDNEARSKYKMDVWSIGAGGTYLLPDQFVDHSFPLRLKFQTDAGLDITISNPQVINSRDGWEITFTTPPSNADVVVIYDGSSVGTTQAAGRAFLKDGDIVSHRSMVKLNPGENLPDIYEIESPFKEDELDDLYFAQANDQMFLCQANHKPWRLTRYNPYDWRFEQPEMVGAPWEDAQYSPVDGYPEVVTFFQERLWFAATLALPQTVWGSEVANFYEFTLPLTSDPYDPDDPVEYTVAAYTHEMVEWVSSERVLVFGTSQTEHRLSPDQYISADRLPKVSRMSAYGGAHVMPAYMGNMTVFVHSSRQQLRSYAQSSQSVIEKWDSIELDWAAEHLTRPGIKQIAYAMHPHSVLLMVTDDGDMLAMTYETSLGEAANPGWTKNTTEGFMESLCVIPSDNDDQGWFATQREVYTYDDQGEIATTEKFTYVEYHDPNTFTDSCLTYPPSDFVDTPDLYPPLQKLGNLDHLEGQEVTIRVNGNTHPPRTVLNGEVELNDAYQFIEVGLNFTPYVKLKRHEGGNPAGTDQGQMGRWSEIWLRLVESAYPKVNGKRPPERNPSTPMNSAEPLITGDVKVRNFGHDTDKQIEIEQDLPVEFYLTSIFGTYEVHSG